MLKPYDVMFTDNDMSSREMTFWAEDEHHAIEQCENAEPGCDVEWVFCCVPADEPYVIASADNEGDCYWSNEDGWTSLEGATVFAYSEIQDLNLPLASPVAATWVPLNSLMPCASNSVH